MQLQLCCDATIATYNDDALRVVGQEVQDPPALLEVVLGVGPQAPDQVWELDAITHKEDLHNRQAHSD